MRLLRVQTRRAALLLVFAALCVAALWLRPWASQPRWYEESVAAFNQRDLQKAAQGLEHGLRNDPQNFQAYSLLADCYLAGGKVDQALTVLNRLQSLSPDYPHLASRIAETYISSDRLVLLRLAREAVIAEPRSPRAHLLLAYAIARCGGAADALFQARLAEQIDPSVGISQELHVGAPFQDDPAKLGALIRKLIFRVPYE